MKEFLIKVKFDDDGGYKGHGEDTIKLILNGLKTYMEYDLEDDNVIKSNWSVNLDTSNNSTNVSGSNMEKLNNSSEISNIDKKISVVMNSIVSALESIKNDYVEVRSDSSCDKDMKERMNGGISALEKSINIVKKYCS